MRGSHALLPTSGKRPIAEALVSDNKEGPPSLSSQSKERAQTCLGHGEECLLSGDTELAEDGDPDPATHHDAVPEGDLWDGGAGEEIVHLVFVTEKICRGLSSMTNSDCWSSLFEGMVHALHISSWPNSVSEFS
jgi:hypothetical protein